MSEELDIFEKIKPGDQIVVLWIPAFGKVQLPTPKEIVAKLDVGNNRKMFLIEDPDGLPASGYNPKFWDVEFLESKFPAGTRFTLIPAERVLKVAVLTNEVVSNTGEYFANLISKETGKKIKFQAE